MLKNTSLNTRILGFSIVALLGVGGLTYLLSSSDDGSHKVEEVAGADAQNPEGVTTQAQDEAGTANGVVGLPVGAPTKDAGARSTASAKSSQDGKALVQGVGAASGALAMAPSSPSVPSSENAQVSELPRYKSDCLKADLESQTKELKGNLHEFQLPRKFSKNEELCVFVDGKSVQYSRIDSERVRIDWKIAAANTKVSASYCNEGKKCKLTCPAPEKDFWDTIGDGSAAGAGEGFVANESAEEKELQKELKALKDVLNRKPAQAKVALWKIASVSEIACK